MPSERVQRRINRLLDQAEEAADRDDWTEVSRVARMVLKAAPDNADAETFLAMVEESGVALTIATPVVGSAAVADPSDTPTTFANGRYTVSRFLGEGGKKRVYLAHDNTLDRDVAFALIKTEGLDDTSRERVKREAQAMGRMGTHPCIMPIYDLGEEPDADGVAQPFMVQPLMGGGDVEELIEDAEGPLSLKDAIRIATQTAQGLVFAHGKGIVHRDLKPGNVWMDEDGAAKIGDFGLAVATDRSRLTVEKMMVGTVNYMPPEQATGGEVTPKADLYSLGAMLYEMATGRVPFMGDDDIAVISQHVNTPPVAPSWHNALIPKTLDSLILRMMAKDPAERPADAEEVLAALNAVDLSAVEERDESGKGSLDAMAGGVFVGRHREMDQLKAGFEEVLSGKGRMVTLVGEPGIGKTRTAQELATYASMRGAEVLWGRSYESGGAPPYWPWVQAIRSHVSATESETLRVQLSSTAPVIAEVVPDVKAKLPDTPAPTPIEDPESARFRLFDSVSTFLKNTASTTPLVLMLEDLHWADKPSLMLLEFVARELANSRIMIVGNYRDMELNRRHPLSVTLGDLSRERLFERVVLRGLQKHDVQRFIEIAAGITPPPALVETVFKQTEGNPLFVTETVRLLIQEGDITSGSSSKGGTTSWEIRIPEGVREVIGRRLDRLSERCNEVLTIAAVIGRQFRFDVLKMLMEDTTDGQLLDAMDEALSARIIEELPDEVGFYQFTHAQMQETLTDELSHTRAVRMHAQIAEVLEEYWDDKAEAHAEELVEHLSEAEVVLGTDKLVKYSLAAGWRALTHHAHEAGLHFYGIACAILADNPMDDTKATAIWGYARCELPTAPLEQAQSSWDSLTTVFDYYIETGNNELAVQVASNPTANLGAIRGAADLIERAVGVTDANSRDRAYLLTRLAISTVVETSDSKRSVAAADMAAEIAHSIKAFDIEALAYGSKSLVLWMLREDEAAKESAKQAISTPNFDSEPQAGVRAHQVLGGVLLNEGDVTGGLVQMEAYHEAALRTHDSSWIERSGTMIRNVRRLKGESVVFDGGLDSTSKLLSEFERDGTAEQESQICKSFEALEASETFGVGGDLAFGAQLAYSLDSYAIAHAVSEYLKRSVLMGSARLVDNRRYQMFDIASGLLAAFNQEGDEAKAALDRLNPLMNGTLPSISLPRLKAILSMAIGDSDGAAKHFQAAVELGRNHALKLDLAYSCAGFAEFLSAPSTETNREKAIELQDEAIRIATELGMKPLLERVLAKREILKA